MSKTPAPNNPAPNNSEPQRRSFLYHAATTVLSIVLGIGPLLAGLAVFFDPLRSKQTSAEGDGEDSGNWLRIASIDALPADGIPRQFPVIADRVDAWNRTPNQPVGLLYMRRKPESKTIEVLNAVCPHAGCFVGVTDGSDGKEFLCPCHTSAFSLDGEKLDRAGKTNPSPRNMDPLEVDEEKLAQTGEIWVNFKNFYPGKHDRVEKS